MSLDYLIKLTLLVYQETEAWPGTNFLKSRIRNLTNEILIDFILISLQNLDFKENSWLFEDIDSFQECLFQARNQKLIDRKTFLLFQEEYERIKKGSRIENRLKKRTDQAEEKEIDRTSKAKRRKKPDISLVLNQRQRKILDILEEKEKIQVWQLKESFLEVSKRTLRRDLEELLKKGLVKRDGKWNEVFYVLTEVQKDG